MSRARLVATVCLALIVGAAAMWPSGTSSAHPLGNFTINHSTTIEVSETGIVVFRVLEYAEDPAFQVLQDSSTDADGFVLLDPWAASRPNCCVQTCSSPSMATMSP